MKVGLIAIQGFFGEYERWDPARAVDHMLAHAQHCDELGFESIWLFDHFTPERAPVHSFMFESFLSAAAIARATQRIRVGHLVACAGFRSPALTAKMAGTLDALSGGRYELGLGAGWKEDEWRSYGYGFPSLATRLAGLEEAVIQIKNMLAAPERDAAGSRGPLNEPRGLQQPRVPLLVGGNGRRITWRLAASYADELNLDGPGPEEVELAQPVIAAHCDAVGRDRKTLRLSVNVRGDILSPAARGGTESAAGTELLRRYAALGVDRVQVRVVVDGLQDTRLDRFAEACANAGLEGRW